MWYSGIGIGIASMFVLSFFVSQFGHFHNYWVGRSKEWNQANIFFSSENCKNPVMRSQLGSFNLCDSSEIILSQYPLMTAIHDVAQDLNICGRERCSLLYMDITANLHKIVIGAGLLAILGLYVARKMLKDNTIDVYENRYSLPSHKKKIF